MNSLPRSWPQKHWDETTHCTAYGKFVAKLAMNATSRTTEQYVGPSLVKHIFYVVGHSQIYTHQDLHKLHVWTTPSCNCLSHVELISWPTDIWESNTILYIHAVYHTRFARCWCTKKTHMWTVLIFLRFNFYKRHSLIPTLYANKVLCTSAKD